MKFKSSRNDMTIQETQRFRRLQESFLGRCRQFGYHEIKTATIQPLHLFTALGAMNEKRLRRIYSFIDWDGWSGERVALKPDSTACVAILYDRIKKPEQHNLRLCYIENHFEWADTWDAISERWQCGIENIGNSRAEADIEVIYMACDILRQIGLDNFGLRLSYPSITEVIRKFLPPDTRGAGESLDHQESQTAGFLANLSTLIPAAEFSQIRLQFENFYTIARSLDQLDLKYRFDFSPLSDLAYYSGIQFQLLSGIKRVGSDVLCSGGRYDNYIAEACGIDHNIPAVGFALYARNIIRHPAMIEDSSTESRMQYIMICVTNLIRQNVAAAQRLCDQLSALGFVPQITFEPLEVEDYANFGLVIEVDHERFSDGYQVLFSQKIGKPLLENLFREFGRK